MGKGPKRSPDNQVETLTVLEAVKMFCKICQGLPLDTGSLAEIRACKSEWGNPQDSIDAENYPMGCPLWPFRLGKDSTRKFTDEQKQELISRINKTDKYKVAA